jgi:hypothetical protein
MNMHKIIKKTIIVGMAATIGFGTFALEGTHTAQAASATSTGQKVINYGGLPTDSGLPQSPPATLTVLPS